MPGEPIGLNPRGLLASMLLLGASQVHAADDFLYTVQPGDHPWNIAQRFLQGSESAQNRDIAQDFLYGRPQPGLRES